jgi:hypothetical protein
MKWFNSIRDGFPQHNDEVLIAVKGVYHVAIYDSHDKAYRSKRNQKIIFRASQETIYWQRSLPVTNWRGAI